MNCEKCNMERIEGQPDPCLGLLPGVAFACCGHGGQGYIKFTNGKVIRFPSALVDDITNKVILIDPCKEYEMDEHGNILDGDGSILVPAPVYLRDLRKRIEAGEDLPKHDWGGCGCGGATGKVDVNKPSETEGDKSAAPAITKRADEH